MRRVFYSSLIPVMSLIALISVAASDGAAQRPSLELVDVKQSATVTTISLVGEVKNVSTSDVSGVTVYWDFLNGAGKVVRTEQTNLDTDPLKPNATSEFKVSTKASPEIKGYGIPRFERIFGGPLAVRDARKK